MVRTTGFRIQDSGFTRLLWNLIPALPLCCLLVAGIIKAQMPANTSVASVNAKWVTDRGSQVYNVKAYGAKCDGVTDDSGAFAATLAAIPAGGGTFFIPPSATPCVLGSARLAIATSNVLVSGYGATLLCAVADDCVTTGNLSTSSANFGISIKGLGIEPGAGSAGHSAIRDNSQGTHIEDVTFPANGSYGFNHLIENDDDESQVADKFFLNGHALACSSSFCGAALWGNPAGNSGNAAGITFASNYNIDPECQGNAVDWQLGTHLTLSNGVMQAVNQFFIRETGVITKHMVYEEVGNCQNPLGNVGIAGDIMNGGSETADGMAPSGSLAHYVFTGTAGTAVYGYYIVVHNTASGFGASVPLLAGIAVNASATIDASDTVAVLWNAIPTASTYDVLRVTFVGGTPAPYGTGNFAVATGLTPSVCSNGVCSFTDNVTSPSSYTVNSYPANYVPYLPLWGADLVLSDPPTNGSNNFYVGSYSGPQPTISTINVCGGGCLGNRNVSFGFGPDDATNGGYPYSPNNELALGGWYPYAPGSSALLLPSQFNGSSGLGGIKGGINLGDVGQENGPIDLITWADSNYAKTVSTVGHRPSYDAGDTATCQDNQYPGYLCTRAATSISQYINSLPDGSSWLERLTSGVKTFRVPLNGFAIAQIPSTYIGGVNDVATGGTLSPNTQYCYRATGVDSLGETAPSAEVCQTTANDGNSTHSISILIRSQALAGGGYKVYGRTSGTEQLITSTPITNTYPGTWAAFTDTGSVTPSGAMPTINTTGQVKPALYSTAANCSSSASPAICGSAAAGSFVIGASTTSVVVDTTAVTANSQILLTEDSSLGTKLGVTCNTQSLLTLGVPKVTARTSGTSFAASIEVGPTTNPMCVSYAIIN